MDILGVAILNITLKKNLSRITTSGLYIAEVDGLRFIAISLVLLQHMQQAVLAKLDIFITEGQRTAEVISKMAVGVELFFVISGFILALPFANSILGAGSQPSLINYYRRRLTRLEPPYIIIMVVLFLMTNDSTPITAERFQHFMASIFYLHNVIYGTFSTINGVTWSLEVEVQFYLIAPILASLIFRPKTQSVRCAVLLSISFLNFILRHFLERYFGPLPPSILFHLHYFLIGLLVADIYVTNWRSRLEKTYTSDLLALIAVVALIISSLYVMPAKSLITGAILFIFFSNALRGKIVSHFLCYSPVTIIGGACYSIYLLHLPLIELVIASLPDIRLSPFVFTNTLIYSAVCLLVVIPVCLLFFILVERPCMDRNWPIQAKKWFIYNFRRP